MSHEKNEMSRRAFLFQNAPVCFGTLACLGANVVACGATAVTESTQNQALFDKKMEEALTYRQYFANRYHDYVEFAKFLKKEMGDEAALALVKKHSEERMLAVGKRQAQSAKELSLEDYVGHIKNDPIFQHTLPFEILEESKTVFRIKVTGCVWASCYRELDAADIGYATHCLSDFAWIKGYSPKIKLVRDKTLMEGDTYCNHAYSWTEG